MSNRRAFTLAEGATHVGTCDNVRKSAFTLAEVLITLAIIGVVAAMTIPTLISNYQKKVVENKLSYFYSSMNQAIRLSEIENGDKKYWFDNSAGNLTDEDGNSIEYTSKQSIWFDTYLAPYLKIIKKDIKPDSEVHYYFPNGTVLRIQRHILSDWLLYVKTPEKCPNDTYLGTCYFAFSFCPNCTAFSWRFAYDKGLEPFSYLWEQRDDINEAAEEKCKAGGKTSSVNNKSYCTMWIKNNNWKIPEDYPLKF